MGASTACIIHGSGLLGEGGEGRGGTGLEGRELGRRIRKE